MYGITGIKEQDNLEQLPFFNKQTAEILVGKSNGNLDKKLERLSKIGYLVNLKRGVYVSKPYLNNQRNLQNYSEYLANQLRTPSYLSLEYVLSKYSIIPESINTFSSITLKSTRVFQNDVGIFSYRSIKDILFTGYSELKINQFNIYLATKPKALFDFLYLKRNISQNLTYELREGLRINWGEISKDDLKELAKYTKLSQSQKMNKILKIILKIKDVN